MTSVSFFSLFSQIKWLGPRFISPFLNFDARKGISMTASKTVNRAIYQVVLNQWSTNSSNSGIMKILYHILTKYNVDILFNFSRCEILNRLFLLCLLLCFAPTALSDVDRHGSNIIIQNNHFHKYLTYFLCRNLVLFSVVVVNLCAHFKTVK